MKRLLTFIICSAFVLLFNISYGQQKPDSTLKSEPKATPVVKKQAQPAKVKEEPKPVDEKISVSDQNINDKKKSPAVKISNSSTTPPAKNDAITQ